MFATKEVEAYFWEKYEKQQWRVAYGHWPDFSSKEEVDGWIDLMSKLGNIKSYFE